MTDSAHDDVMLAADLPERSTEKTRVAGRVRLGLTGGIASGKTLVAAELAALGAVIIDADLLAREVVAPGTAGLQRVVDRFGCGILRADGSLDRAALGEVVFGDDTARQELNTIVHPLVRSAARAQEAALDAEAVVVHVVPLLVETQKSQSFDGVIVVDAPEAVQLERLRSRNALSEDQARARLRAQATREQRLAAAAWVIDNSGDVESTRSQVRALWAGPVAGLRAEEAERCRAAVCAQPDPDQLSGSPQGGQEQTRLRSP